MSFNPGGGGKIATATDVALSNPANNQALVFDSNTQLWMNKPTPGVQSATSARITVSDTQPSNPQVGDIWLITGASMGM